MLKKKKKRIIGRFEERSEISNKLRAFSKRKKTHEEKMNAKPTGQP